MSEKRDSRFYVGCVFLFLGIINNASCYVVMLDHAENDHETPRSVAAFVVLSVIGPLCVGMGTQQWCAIVSERWLFPPPTYVRIQYE